MNTKYYSSKRGYFGIGIKVKLHKPTKKEELEHWIPEMDELVGKVFEISAICEALNDTNGMVYLRGGNYLKFHPDWLEPVKE